MTPQRPPVETAFAFSAHPVPATATGEVIGAVYDSGVMATTVIGLFAGSWPTGSRRLAWRTICRVLRPEVAVAGALPEILHPRSEVPSFSDRRQHRSLAVVATDNGPAEIVGVAGRGEPTSGAGPMITFTGRDVAMIMDTTGSRAHDTASADPTRAPLRSSHRFLAVDTDTGDRGAVAVRFDPSDVSLMEFQGVRPLSTNMRATIHGREITTIDNRPALDVVDELTAEIDRPDLRPETLLIGVDDKWYRIIAVDRAVGSLILAATPDNIVGGGFKPAATMPSIITVAVPDLVDAMIAIERRIGRGRRTLLAVSSQYVQRPNEVGADHDVDDLAADLAPLIVPSPELAPGRVRALVFGGPQIR